ncbi:hypothetical protein AYJ57_21460 (plasmid) [Salipiger sp. CCB-MM3]|uniref:META domain-containing protein n=1 Tax=Salipiger sp. CCB-MM3 TaxID=1792508 RepID=UPI00080A9D4C|nr:META domain-containing protein [Salipiger sp. CCB-MM3]ANT63044.1 hypothetical protein AYJ57_21460 [Salipiger sp. CCB-MM3]
MSFAMFAQIAAGCVGNAKPPALSGVATQVDGKALKLDQSPSIQFHDDGRFSMFAGCNTHNGQEEITDTVFMLVGPMASTRKLCFEDWRTQLEQAMVDPLGEAEGYVLNGPKLTLTNASGVPLASFTASAK